MCGICGGGVHISGRGDYMCLGSCSTILTREEIEAAHSPVPAHPQPEEYDDYEDDVIDEWNDGEI